MWRMLPSRRRRTVILVAGVLCAQSMVPAMAFDEFRHLQPVTEVVLDRMRGGFQSDPNGPIMSFGIERSVYLNGRLVNSTVLHIPNLLQLTNNPSAFTLIQNGAGNAMTTHPASLMTVLQNSLDNQTIQNQTVINATVTALSISRSLALGYAVSQANLGAIHH